MPHRITVLPQQVHIEAAAEDNLLNVLRKAGLAPTAPCGGLGRCGKCRISIDGKDVLACQVTVDRDLTVTLPEVRTQKNSYRRCGCAVRVVPCRRRLSSGL